MLTRRLKPDLYSIGLRLRTRPTDHDKLIVDGTLDLDGKSHFLARRVSESPLDGRPLVEISLRAAVRKVCAELFGIVYRIEYFRYRFLYLGLDFELEFHSSSACR